MTKTTARLRDDEGQSAVEFAFVLPILFALLFAIWQVGAAFTNYLAITDAARVAARYVAVSPINANCLSTASSKILDPVASPLSAKQRDSVSISCTPAAASGQPLTITITHPFKIGLGSLPAVGFIGTSGTLKATASERHE
jgi:Flp pilus assembly protein TadG